MKILIKKFIPKNILKIYHAALALFFAWYFGYPSNKLLVIGVTGTNGKSSTVHFISDLLECLGYTTGHTSTIDFKVAKKRWTNTQKMGMPGRGMLQKYMREMVKAGCSHAIIETTSEGIAQFRHWGIAYDVMALTNITPEHIESHGSFKKYREAKKAAFTYLASLPPKKILGKDISRGVVLNVDSEHVEDFFDVQVQKKVLYGIEGKEKQGLSTDILAKNIICDETGTHFDVGTQKIETKLIGHGNVYNVLAVLGVLKIILKSDNKIESCIGTLQQPPGRLERINVGQPFSVIVDYAHDPAALNSVYAAIESIEHRRTIHIVGSAGGGRDKGKRVFIGEIAGKNADIVIVTNEDPYEENPREIILEVAKGAEKEGKEKNKNLMLIEERSDAIAYAVKIAKRGDLVLITGKGSEETMMVKTGAIAWSDRETVIKEIRGSVDKV